MENQLPYLFVIEGIDGSGKSTVIRLIKRYIHFLNLDSCFVFFKEPTDLETGKKIRKLLQAKEQLSSKEWFDLFVEDREQNVRYNLIPNRDKIILMDRYYFSTAAYQAQTFEEVDYFFDYSFRKFPLPREVFFLELKPEMALQRIHKRSEIMDNNFDVFEKKENLERIYHNYQHLYILLKKQNISFSCINSEKKPYQIANTIIRKIFSEVSK